MMRVVRRTPTGITPQFELALPPRPLIPMEAVSSSWDGQGETVVSYAVSTTDSSGKGTEGKDKDGGDDDDTKAQEGGEGGASSSFGPSASPQSFSTLTTGTGPAACNRTWSPYAATEIIPRLFLGGQENAQSIAELTDCDVRYILNVAEECEIDLDLHNQLGITAKHLCLRDHSDETIANHFEESIEFIHAALHSGHSVLVHCRHGVSRSATMVIAFLMRYGVNPLENPSPMPYEQAFDYVKERRPHVSPNLGFVLALKALEGISPSTDIVAASIGSCPSTEDTCPTLGCYSPSTLTGDLAITQSPGFPEERKLS